MEDATTLWYSDWKDLDLKLQDLFHKSSSFPRVLISIIISYCVWKEWETTACSTLTQNGLPTGILTSSKRQCLYICNYNPHVLLTYNPLQNEKIKENYSSFIYPYGIDLDEQQNILYIADKNNITLLNFNLEVITSWVLPSNNGYWRGLKINNHILYLTIDGRHQIYLCNVSDGVVIKNYGNYKYGFKVEEFNFPVGMSVENKYLYVCDCFNNRVQILHKETGRFIKKWGDVSQFHYPCSIYYHIPEEIFYIGDEWSVQLISKHNNLCIQRLGDLISGNLMNQFSDVFGICIGTDDRLYISDRNNNRVQIYKRTNKGTV